MRNLLIIDMGIIVIAVVTAFLKGDPTLIIDIVGITGLIFFVISGLFSGAFVSGERVRANYYPEEEEERRQKNRLTRDLFYVGVFNITITFLTYKFILQRLSMI